MLRSINYGYIVLFYVVFTLFSVLNRLLKNTHQPKVRRFNHTMCLLKCISFAFNTMLVSPLVLW